MVHAPAVGAMTYYVGATQALCVIAQVVKHRKRDWTWEYLCKAIDIVITHHTSPTNKVHTSHKMDREPGQTPAPSQCIIALHDIAKSNSNTIIMWTTLHLWHDPSAL